MKDEAQMNKEYDVVGETVKSYGFGIRHFQTFLFFMVLCSGYVIRTTLSVSIIAMTDGLKNDTNSETFDWDKTTQGYILSSFFWGYMLMQIPSGQLAQRFGGKMMLGVAMISNGFLFIVFPYVIRFGGWKAALILRVLQGLTQACLMPSIHTLLGKWAPVAERSRLGNFVIAGSSVGTVIGMSLSGFLCQRFGWPIAFQAVGIFTVLIGVCWFSFGYNSPAKHPKITNEERTFIQTSLGQTTKPKILKTPWKSFVTSVPLWALFCTQVGHYWSFLIMILEIPNYMKLALGIDVQQSGIYSAIPFIAMWCFSMLMSFVADFLINKNIMSITATRKLANTIGCWGSSLGLVILSFIPTTEVTWCLVVLTLSAGVICTCNVGLMLNHIDLSPNFAGILMAIINCASNAVGLFAPITVGIILTDTSNTHQWQTVFFMTAAIPFFTNLVFLLFGTAEKQSWNEPEDAVDTEMTKVAVKDSNE